MPPPTLNSEEPAKSLANLERRIIRALRLRDPYCVVTSEERKTQWKRQ